MRTWRVRKGRRRKGKDARVWGPQSALGLVASSFTIKAFQMLHLQWPPEILCFLFVGQFSVLCGPVFLIIHKTPAKTHNLLQIGAAGGQAVNKYFD